jgi:hypothetical protein
METEDAVITDSIAKCRITQNESFSYLLLDALERPKSSSNG